jgi:hypothetical protein
VTRKLSGVFVRFRAPLQQYYPKTELIQEGTALEEILNTIQGSKIKYP